MTQPIDNTFRYIPGFDGLRALAVLAVIAYHLNLPYSQGGFLGVTVFFVISGFLITSLLLHEWKNTFTIHLRSFWIRRAKRLLPAMFLLLIFLNIATPLIRPELTANLRQDTVAAFFYYSNWHYIFQDLSYFEAFEKPSLLTHFWSLAIEEQFYIVWAVLILFFLKYIQNRNTILGLIVLASFISTIRMAVLYDPSLDPSRVYYGTDTRMFSLLIGASFAFIQPHPSQTTKGRWIYEGLALFCLLIFLSMVIYTNQYDSFIYNGGMAALSITTAMLVLILSQSPTVLAKVLETPLLRWIGIRSYGIYLWHYPVILFMNAEVNTGSLNPIKIILELTLTFILAAMSYSFVEKPIRHGKYSFTIKKTFVITGVVLLMIFLSNSVVQFGSSRPVNASLEEEKNNHIKNPDSQQLGPETNSADADVPAKGNVGGSDQQSDHMNHLGGKNNPVRVGGSTLLEEDAGSSSVGREGGNSTDETSEPSDPIENDTMKPTSQPTEQGKEKSETSTIPLTEKMTAIGDSVLINPALYLEQRIPHLLIDAKVSRQMGDALEIVENLKTNNMLGNIVVIELGTNGPFPEKTLISLIEAIGDKRKILLVNVRVPRPWESVVNKTLVEVANKYSNATIVDWYTTSANHDEYFVSDGVHLKPEGAKAYASMIEKAIREVLSSD
jgi:peptidoglycan/LPS O-acetylase OafA/YrhL